MNNPRATRAVARTVIKASPQEVWSRLEDPTQIAAFHPLIRTSRAAGQTGSDRECEFIPMGVARERVVRTESGLFAEMTGGERMPPIDTMTGELTVTPRGDGTEVAFRLEYTMKRGVLPALMNAVMVRQQFTRAPAYYVAGLRHLVEFGRKASATELKRLGWIAQ